MKITRNPALQALEHNGLSLGFGVSLLRTVAVAPLAKTAGYHWLSLDMEHGSLTLSEASQLCITSLAVGISPIVRVRSDALDEGIRALDNGAQGVIVPHVNNAAEARRITEAFLYPPSGQRNWSGNGIQFGYQPPAIDEAQKLTNGETLIVAMIETPEGVSNVDEIASTPGVNVVFLGMLDYSVEIGIPRQFGHERMQEAVRRVADSCLRHGKVLGMGGVYDEVWARRYVEMGARFIAGGNDQIFLSSAATERAAFLRNLLVNSPVNGETK